MKQFSTSAFKNLCFLIITLGIFKSNSVFAQTNVALTATAVNGPSGGAGCPPATTSLYGPCYYNNNIVPPYNTGGSGGAWSYPNSQSNNGADDWIKFYWTPGNVPTPGTITKVVFYKDNRPAVKGLIQYWDAGLGAYVTCATYNNSTNIIADSISFPAIPIATDTIRFFGFNVGSGSSTTTNPNFREIQIWSLPNCTATPNPVIQAQYNGNIVNAPVTNVCVGNTVSLGDLEAFYSSGHSFQWQYSSATSGPWSNIPGATNAGINVNAYNTVYYRVVDTCKLSGLYAASPSVEVTSSAVTYAAMTPTYFQNFDNWSTACALAPYTLDVPGQEWSNVPPSGLNTWRIENTTSTTTSGWSSALVWPYTNSVPNTIGAHSARLRTTGMSAGSVGNLDLHIDLSTATGGKALYFYMVNAISGLPGSDSLRVLFSTNNGVTWTQLASWDTAQNWRRRVVPINSNAANAIIRFQGYRNTDITLNDQTDIGIDSVYIAGPCSGMPLAGFLNMSSPITACPGTQINFVPQGVTMAGGLIYTWEQSLNGCVTFDTAAGGSGYTNYAFMTPALYDTICYRLKVRCNSDSAYTSSIQFLVPEPQYAAMPFAENFETWTTRCINTSICPTCSLESPSTNWVNFPTVGNNSWRRQDQGNLGNWSNNINGAITGNAPQGGFYARFHSNQTTLGVNGNLDLFINCSTFIGAKELQFLYNNASGPDSLKVFLSTNGGGTFSKIATIGPNANGWVNQIIPIVSNSPKTIIRLQGSSDNNGSDIGIDQLVVIPPCNGVPNPGVISSANPCPGAAFSINLQNLSLVANLNFQWQQATSPNGPWTSIAGATTTSYSTNTVYSNIYYRVRAICLNSNDTAYTPVKLISIASFYYCYCNSNATSSIGADIGNVKIMWSYIPPLPQPQIPTPLSTILDNGNAAPLTMNSNAIGIYSDFRFPVLPITPLYHDSTYYFSVTQINSSNFSTSTASIWIDMDRNGIFDPNERILKSNTSQTSSPPELVDTFYKIPDTLAVGITGMRVVIENPQNSSSLPCGQYSAGETEDYLVEIRYPPCDGPTNAGSAYTRDTLGCPGYVMTFGDTTHEHKRHNISWLWEYSPDGNSWAEVPNSLMHDSVTLLINGPTYARLRMICVKDFTIDTTFSNVVQIHINPPYACYCYSLADGGTADSSDLGSFVLGNYSFDVNSPGPHLWNGQAIQSRTDNTKDTIGLWTDSTYQFMFYHTMNSGFHADAKITVFMDFNNDLQYNITPNYNERVFTGYTSVSNYLINGFLTIPSYAIPNIKTGMRVILNNNTGPSVQSDSACGPFTSGETEDFVVIFHSFKLGVDETNNITQAFVYPNPTDGEFVLSFNTKELVDLATVSVYNMMGQQVLQRQYQQPSKEFSSKIDLSAVPKGVYIVELKADEERIVRRIIVK